MYTQTYSGVQVPQPTSAAPDSVSYHDRRALSVSLLFSFGPLYLFYRVFTAALENDRSFR